jgi:hypothetical protein
MTLTALLIHLLTGQWLGVGPVFLGMRLTAEGSHFHPGQQSVPRKQLFPWSLLGTVVEHQPTSL